MNKKRRIIGYFKAPFVYQISNKGFLKWVCCRCGEFHIFHLRIIKNGIEVSVGGDENISRLIRKEEIKKELKVGEKPN